MNYSNVTNTGEDSFGPGTDLVFSLVALLLIIIPVVLYVQSRTDFVNRLYAIRLHNQQASQGGTVAELQQNTRKLQLENREINVLVSELTKERQIQNTQIDRLKEQLDKLGSGKETLLARVHLLQEINTANITDREKFSRLQARLDELEQDKTNIVAYLAASKKEIVQLRQQSRKNKPPIIPLQEASGYTFKTASAELSSRFKLRLTEVIIPQLRSIVSEFDVNTIEIVGHTDSVPVFYGRRSNLDKKLEDVYRHRGLVKGLHFSSNTELGLLRALAVKNFLEDNLDNDFPGVSFRIYSAAQLVPVKAKGNAARRRIELRFTKLCVDGA